MTKPTTRQPMRLAPPIVWACFLGCNTAARLANEWGISERGAFFRLNYARRKGWLKRVWRTSRKGIYRKWLVSPEMLAAAHIEQELNK